MHLAKKEISGLSCFLVSYFEDIISSTNIWNTFIEKHTELYGKKLPFYDTSEYFENEINLQDLRFLIWYFIDLKVEGRFVWPSNAFMQALAEEVMEIFDAEYEFAPENEDLKSCYTVPADAVFYEVRELMYRLFADTYLFFPDTGVKFREMVKGIVSDEKDVERANLYLREGTDRFVFFNYSKLLSLRANEWVALVLGKDHPLYEDVLAISPRAQGWFFYKGKNQTHIHLEHIASRKKIELLKASYLDHDKLEEGNLMSIGMAKWKGEWWFSGISAINEFDADLVLDQKNSVDARRELNFLEDQGKIKEGIHDQEKAFLEFNKGSLVAFLGKDQINAFSKSFFEFYNEGLGLSKKEKKASKQRAKDEGLFGKDEEIDFGEDFENAVVFFNPVSGLEFYFDVASVFSMKENPFYNEKEKDADFLEMLFSNFHTKEMLLFCKDNFREDLEFFQRKPGYDDDEFDFLLRFFKNNIYHTEPQITFYG